MKRKKLFAAMLAAAMLPTGIMAQTDVNREKYPDYSDIMPVGSIAAASIAANSFFLFII